MKRLVELEGGDRLLLRAHELIDAVGPTVTSEARLQRVRQSLDEPPGRSPARWQLRVVLAMSVLGVAASALAWSGLIGPASEPAPPQLGPPRTVAKILPATATPEPAPPPLESAPPEARAPARRPQHAGR